MKASAECLYKFAKAVSEVLLHTLSCWNMLEYFSVHGVQLASVASRCGSGLDLGL